MKYSFAFLAATIALMGMTSVAHADTTSNEWAGIRKVLSVMGKGTLSPADQKSMLDILDTKNALEPGTSTSSPVAYPATPISPDVVKKQPPHRSPSAF